MIEKILVQMKNLPKPIEKY